ncbi:hypothetical protein JCM10212_004209 [Sporobolomyces blumeae]
MRETIERFKRLTYEFDETRDEMGRLSHRAHKIEKRDTDATGQEIHDLMFNLVQATDGQNCSFGIPCPLQSSQVQKVPHELFDNLDRVTPLLSIISLASSTMPTLSSSPQRAAVEALIAEARDEIEILLAEMRRDVPYTTTERDLLAFQ